MTRVVGGSALLKLSAEARPQQGVTMTSRNDDPPRDLGPDDSQHLLNTRRTLEATPRQADGTGSMPITTIANWELRLIELPRPGGRRCARSGSSCLTSPSLAALTAEAARISTRPGRRHDTFSPWPRNRTPRGVDVPSPGRVRPSRVVSERQEPAASVIALQFAFLASQRLAAAAPQDSPTSSDPREGQPPMRANALEQMKAVETHPGSAVVGFNPGGEIAPSQVPPKSHCSPVTKLGTGSDSGTAQHSPGRHLCRKRLYRNSMAAIGWLFIDCSPWSVPCWDEPLCGSCELRCPSRRCLARQAVGVSPDQRRNARVKALASE